MSRLWWKRNYTPDQVALCLNSSFFGFFAHSGFLHSLTMSGFTPGHISGASAGALVAGLYASGLDTGRICALLRDPRIASVFRERGSMWRLFRTLIGREGATGALAGHQGRALLRDYLGERRIEECSRARLAISVANLSRVESELLRHGKIVDAVLASCAVPGMFAAQAVGADLYWDGGVADPVPFEHWLEDRRVRLIVIHLALNTAELQSRAAPHRFGFYGGLARSHQIISDEIYRLKSELARRAGKRLLVYRTITPRPGPHLLNLGPRCQQMGARTATRAAHELGAMVRLTAARGDHAGKNIAPRRSGKQL
ncbi:MAG: patatin-like phospholipase family protein [Spirochaetales bacterium]|nr:patatin-like phospholipase family protein [Spirochaetales bacterium]